MRVDCIVDRQFTGSYLRLLESEVDLDFTNFRSMIVSWGQWIEDDPKETVFWLDWLQSPHSLACICLLPDTLHQDSNRLLKISRAYRLRQINSVVFIPKVYHNRQTLSGFAWLRFPPLDWHFYKTLENFIETFDQLIELSKIKFQIHQTNRVWFAHIVFFLRQSDNAIYNTNRKMSSGYRATQLRVTINDTCRETTLGILLNVKLINLCLVAV